MLLQLGSGEVISDPTEEDVRDALTSFDGGDEAFLILEEDPTTRNYMQATGDGKTFHVEFAEVGQPVQWGTQEKDLGFDTTFHLLRLYLQGDESYKTLVKWEAQEFKSGCATMLLLLALVALLLRS